MKKRSIWKKDYTLLLIAIIIQFIVVPLFNRIEIIKPMIRVSIVLAVEVILLVYLIALVVKTINKKRVVLNEDESTSLSSETEMNRAITNVNNAASTLNEKYSGEKEKLKSLTDEIKTFVPVNDISAIKLEQNIIWKLTEVGNACGAAMAGKPNAQASLDEQLDALKKLISQRKKCQE